MTTFKMVRLVNVSWIWNVTSHGKSADIEVPMEEVLVKLLKIGDTDVDVNLVYKAIAWKKFKEMFNEM